MFSIRIPEKITRITFNLLRAVAIVFFAAFAVFCSFYLLSSHGNLATWYIGLNSCFYHSATWSTDFFTPGIKSDGNMYCALGLTVAIIGSAYTFKGLRSNKQGGTTLQFNINFLDLICSVICVATCAALWACGNQLALPAFDEVFSAQHIADIHPFQGASYYMQPNNHLFFNLLNDLLFRYATDKVLTGRILSFIAYCTVITGLYFAFRSLFRYRLLALLACITLALQFFVWGFSFQARGYELYLLAEWGMVISLFVYMQTQKKEWMYLNILCIVTGYFCLPSFLYFHGAQLLFMLLYAVLYRKTEIQFWKYQLMAVLLTYLCYLPTLAFSGIGSITHNDYVSPSKFKTMTTFWSNMWSPMFRTYLSHIFSDIRIHTFAPDFLLLTLPFLLVFATKNKNLKLAGLFYLCAWLVFFIVATVMKRIPFERNLIGHYSLSLAMLFLLVYWLSGLFKVKIAQFVIMPAVLLAFSVHFMLTNEKFLKETLYEYSVNETYLFHKDRLNIIPAASTVGFSDGEFYSYYICRKNGCMVKKCPDGNEAYYVTQDNEGYPVWLKNNYQLLHKIYNYEIYKHR